MDKAADESGWRDGLPEQFETVSADNMDIFLPRDYNGGMVRKLRLEDPRAIYHRRRLQLFLGLWASVAFCLGVSAVPVILCGARAQGADAHPASKWDQGLPNLELRNIHIQQGSLEAVWQHVMLSHLGIRTVLFMPHALRDGQKRNFEFDREKCTVGELLKALEESYPDFIHTQDTSTGIIWLHPRTEPYEGILSDKITVQREVAALRLRKDMLDNLVSFRQLKLVGGFRGKNAEYPVDLPAGTYSVRDILNFCCVANPGRTFFVGTGRNEEFCWITDGPVIGFNPDAEEVSPGALAYWRAEFDEAAEKAPSQLQLVDALAHEDGQVRLKARRYLDLTLNVSLAGNPVAKVSSFEKVVWFDVAVLGVWVRSDLGGPASLTSSERIKKALKEEDWSGKPGLKALAAMEVARIERDITFLNEAARQPLSAAEIAEVKYDMIRITRLSEFLRAKLLELKPPWAGFSKAEIEELGRTDIFSLP